MSGKCVAATVWSYQVLPTPRPNLTIPHPDICPYTRATPEALNIVFLSISVYMGAAATGSPLSPKSAHHAICANSSSIGR